jgi:predicted GIY-YIG superfamily endonuclease
LTVYLLHFSRRHCHAGHYLGSAVNLPARLTEHQLGRGARLTQVVKSLGITFTVARVWDGGRGVERKLKCQKNGPRLCPICNRRLCKSS